MGLNSLTIRDIDLGVVITVLKQQSDSPIYMWCEFESFFLTSDTYTDFMLRYINNKYENKLVIARCFLDNRRNGYGTRILEELKKIANYYKIPKIEIENVLTNGMESFAIKSGFTLKPCPYGTRNYELILSRD